MAFFENIALHNGWAMAIIGWSIVLTGLAVLSFAISRLKIFFGYIEAREAREKEAKSKPAEAVAARDDRSLLDIQTAIRVYDPLVALLGENFCLAALYEKAREHDLPHAHITISAFRDAKILVPSGEGNFHWEPNG